MWSIPLSISVFSVILPYAMALTASELSQFDAYSPNITYGAAAYNRKLGVDIRKFVSKSLPSYDTTEYDEIDLNKRSNLRVYANPEPADVLGCLKPGPIGVTLSGVVILNVYTSTGKNAITAEGVSLDQCEGHTSPTGTYHYHGVPWCSSMVDDVLKLPDQLVGVALDGYPIYGPFDANGNEITSAQLNDCQGESYVNDEGNTSFRYRLTRDFPYTLGCMYGKTVTGGSSGGSCVKPYLCGENPAYMPEEDPLYAECGGPWPTTPGK